MTCGKKYASLRRTLPHDESPDIELTDEDERMLAERPKTRGDCESLSVCPWCCKTVSMRVNDPDATEDEKRHDGESPQFSCPCCRRRVLFVASTSGESWHWIRYDEATASQRLDAARSDDPGQAINHCRPCVRYSCRHSIIPEYTTRGKHGKMQVVDVAKLKTTCALDAADEGPKTLDEVGRILGVTRERARQIEAKLLKGHKLLRMIKDYY